MTHSAARWQKRSGECGLVAPPRHRPGWKLEVGRCLWRSLQKSVCRRCCPHPPPGPLCWLRQGQIWELAQGVPPYWRSSRQDNHSLWHLHIKFFFFKSRRKFELLLNSKKWFKIVYGTILNSNTNFFLRPLLFSRIHHSSVIVKFGVIILKHIFAVLRLLSSKYFHANFQGLLQWVQKVLIDVPGTLVMQRR